MHPHHVRGFLQESGLPKENVVWVNRPNPRIGTVRLSGGTETIKRLSAQEIAELKKTRNAARMKIMKRKK